LLHSDRSEEFDLECDSVTRHDHFFVSWELNFTSYVRSTEVELRLVTLEEWRVTATFFFGQDVDFSVKLCVWSDATWLTDNLTALDVIALDTTEQDTSVVAGLTLVEDFLNISIPVTTDF
jgi:hypothetical protein